ncbi:hypothetical protein PM082_023141 [Marasmius tenuissimus]|nr:hypothetical protein PM082_004758 [Marasmius tenuissimus]KAJ8095371.1 hypothetical protein PM082_023141 [Marasmius tenuissimus]
MNRTQKGEAFDASLAPIGAEAFSEVKEQRSRRQKHGEGRNRHPKIDTHRGCNLTWWFWNKRDA